MSGVGTVSTAQAAALPLVAIGLDDDRAGDAAVVGTKAAALVRARRAGLPVLPGFAITTAAASSIGDGRAPIESLAALREAWSELSGAGARSLVVRSSSIAEDGGASSMAGRFTSVLDVGAWDSFLAAVAAVAASAGDEAMGVLVQPFLEPAWGGVLFGADPVTGRSDRVVVSAVSGGPDRLVSGQVDGVHYTLSRRGRLREAKDRVPDGLRRRRARRQLASLARRAAAVFGAPQDVEWAIDHDGRSVLLQSRPITALARTSMRQDHCSVPVRWPRRSVHRCARSRTTSGCRRCAPGSVRRCGSSGRHRRARCARARWSSSSTVGSPPTSVSSVSPTPAGRFSPDSILVRRRDG